MSRYSTARGSSTGLVPVGPAKAKARKSVWFTEGTPGAWGWNKEHLFDSVNTLHDQ